MAVHYIQGNNGMLGTLGSLATLGGAVTGMKWLTPLGLGMGAMNAAQNGDSLGALTTMGSLANWQRPMTQQQTQSPYNQEESDKWSPFLHGGWGNMWQR